MSPRLRGLALVAGWLAGALAFQLAAARNASADPPLPAAGFIEFRNTACMRAKHGHGQPCTLPDLALRPARLTRRYLDDAAGLLAAGFVANLLVRPVAERHYMAE